MPEELWRRQLHVAERHVCRRSHERHDNPCGARVRIPPRPASHHGAQRSLRRGVTGRELGGELASSRVLAVGACASARVAANRLGAAPAPEQMAFSGRPSSAGGHRCRAYDHNEVLLGHDLRDVGVGRAYLSEADRLEAMFPPGSRAIAPPPSRAVHRSPWCERRQRREPKCSDDWASRVDRLLERPFRFRRRNVCGATQRIVTAALPFRSRVVRRRTYCRSRRWAWRPSVRISP